MDPALAKEISALASNRALNEAIQAGGSQIQQFYKDTTVFITGGTGFLGKQLVEKLFRSCDIKKIYMLMRPKKNKPFHDRLRLFLEDPVFEILKKQKPDFVNRIHPIQGDAAEPGMGISEQDKPLITQEVDIVIHGAATIKFDEPLKVATLTNVRGTLEMIKLAKLCSKLKSLVHISTAYSHCTNQSTNEELLEKFYEAPLSPRLLVDMAETMEEQRLLAVTPQLIKNWPNTYTFTKAIAEEAVRQAGAYLPICVVRPSIVVCSNREPTPGWLDFSCVYGPTGFLVGGGLGLVHVVNMGPNVKIDLVPVDYVNNAIIAAGWACRSHKIGGDVEPKIYTIATSRNPTTFSQMKTILTAEGLNNYPSPSTVYYPGTILLTNKVLTVILTWLLHYIPAYIVDVVLWCTGKPQIAVSSYKKANKLFSLLSYFTVREWRFNDKNVQALFSRLSEQDKLIYNFDVAKLDWYDQIIAWILGSRKYIVKDGLQGTEYAKKKIRWLKFLHYLVVCPLYLLLLYYCITFAFTCIYLILHYTLLTSSTLIKYIRSS